MVYSGTFLYPLYGTVEPVQSDTSLNQHQIPSTDTLSMQNDLPNLTNA